MHISATYWLHLSFLERDYSVCFWPPPPKQNRHMHFVNRITKKVYYIYVGRKTTKTAIFRMFMPEVLKLIGCTGSTEEAHSWRATIIMFYAQHVTCYDSGSVEQPILSDDLFLIRWKMQIENTSNVTLKKYTHIARPVYVVVTNVFFFT